MHQCILAWLNLHDKFTQQNLDDTNKTIWVISRRTHAPTMCLHYTITRLFTLSPLLQCVSIIPLQDFLHYLRSYDASPSYHYKTFYTISAPTMCLHHTITRLFTPSPLLQCVSIIPLQDFLHHLRSYNVSPSYHYKTFYTISAPTMCLHHTITRLFTLPPLLHCVSIISLQDFLHYLRSLLQCVSIIPLQDFLHYLCSLLQCVSIIPLRDFLHYLRSYNVSPSYHYKTFYTISPKLEEYLNSFGFLTLLWPWRTINFITNDTKLYSQIVTINSSAPYLTEITSCMPEPQPIV